jgi:uncharacterized protein (DUF1499 family)
MFMVIAKITSTLGVHGPCPKCLGQREFQSGPCAESCSCYDKQCNDSNYKPHCYKYILHSASFA